MDEDHVERSLADQPFHVRWTGLLVEMWTAMVSSPASSPEAARAARTALRDAVDTFLPRSVGFVLVLEKKPTDDRWASLAKAVGIQLTWAPEFRGV